MALQTAARLVAPLVKVGVFPPKSDTETAALQTVPSHLTVLPIAPQLTLVYYSLWQGDEPKARVPKMESGIDFLGTRHSLLSHLLIFILPDQCMYIYTYLTAYRRYMNYRCYQITPQ